MILVNFYVAVIDSAKIINSKQITTTDDLLALDSEL